MAKKNNNKAAQEFGTRLQHAMKKKGMDIEALATKIGVGYEMARRYVSGMNAPRHMERLNAIAAAVGVDPVWLEEGRIEDAPTQRVPLVKITDQTLGSTKDWIYAPEGFSGIAVKMTVVLGDGYKQGDIVFVRAADSQLPPAGASVLIELRKASGPKYLFRRAHYGADLSVEYRAEHLTEERGHVFTAKDVKVLGVAEFLLTKLSKD